MNIKKLIDSLVKKHQSRDPFHIIKGMNVILVFAPLNGVRGFYQYFQRNNIIYIDENLPEHEQRFVCAHELGHMLLHQGINTVFMDSKTNLKTSFYEMEADIFAIELLLPNGEIFENQQFITNQLARLTEYNEKFIESRLKDTT